MLSRIIGRCFYLVGALPIAFVLIGQNRSAAFQQAKADHDFREQETMLKENTDLTGMIASLTEQLHDQMCGPAAPPAAG